ncbi:MAG: hypothetical protein WDA42_07530 [Candidatus Bathyarchaeia archaeon]|jgi:hypothetical protein
MIGYNIYNSGEVDVSETFCNVILIAPVGSGNITLGIFRAPDTEAPPGFTDTVTLPVHVKVLDPANQTILEQDTITPSYLPIDFRLRGEYKVYLTNNGEERSAIPIGLQFEEGSRQNIEADKHLLAITLTLLGITLLVIGLLIKSPLKRQRVKE